jgi:hypothetical protein
VGVCAAHPPARGISDLRFQISDPIGNRELVTAERHREWAISNLRFQISDPIGNRELVIAEGHREWAISNMRFQISDPIGNRELVIAEPQSRVGNHQSPIANH